jgi:hypothetical protein
MRGGFIYLLDQSPLHEVNDTEWHDNPAIVGALEIAAFNQTGDRDSCLRLVNQLSLRHAAPGRLAWHPQSKLSSIYRWTECASID